MSISGLSTTTSRPAGETVVPSALRHRRPGWRDPRILIGLAIIAASILLSVKLLGAADQTTPVWAAARDLPAGTALGADDLTTVRVRFSGTELADRYVAAARRPAEGTVLSQKVGAGELLPRQALTGDRAALVEVPLAVEADAVPTTVRRGSVVDVWVARSSATVDRQVAEATRVLDDVVVVKTPEASSGIAPGGTRQIVVGVAEDQAGNLGRSLGRAASGRVLITKQG